MSSIPTESRIFADRYLRETRRLEKVHADRLSPGTANWSDALRSLSQSLGKIGSPIKRVAALRGVVDYLNGLGASSEQIRHISFHYGQSSRTAVFSFATFHSDPNPLHGSGDEDGLNMLMHQIRTDRRGVEIISNLNIAFVSRHAIGRLHQRQDGLTNRTATVAFAVIGALSYRLQGSDKHDNSALHLRLDDVLLVGASRPAVQRVDNGRTYINMLYEVRTALSVADGCDPAALEQGRIATRVALDWLARRGETRKLAETILPLAWRGDDFTSRVAVRN